MKYRLPLLVFIFCISITNSFGQFNETISSDRPGQSNSPNTVGKMVLQVQTGMELSGDRAGNDESNFFTAPAYFRFGITDKIEVQSLWGYQNGNTEVNDIDQKISGINIADLGLRFNIFEETDNAPALGFEFIYRTRMKSKDYKPDFPSTKFNLMASKGFSDLISVTANLGADFNGNDGQPNGFYTLNLVFSANDELSFFFENYGNFNGDYFDTFFDFGGAYILNSNLQLDLFGGFGYNDDTFSYLVSGGLSYRITNWR
jgi:hypothetical protein